MQTRVSHLVQEPDDGPRIVWAPLAIIIVSLAMWVMIFAVVDWVR